MLVYATLQQGPSSWHDLFKRTWINNLRTILLCVFIITWTLLESPGREHTKIAPDLEKTMGHTPISLNNAAEVVQRAP
jgi:hypothetical protein